MSIKTTGRGEGGKLNGERKRKEEDYEEKERRCGCKRERRYKQFRVLQGKRSLLLL